MISNFRYLLGFYKPLYRDMKILLSESYVLASIILLILFVSSFTSEYHEYIMYMALGLAIKEKTFSNFVPYIIQYDIVRFFVMFVGFSALLLYGYDIFSYFNPGVEEVKSERSIDLLSIMALLLYLIIMGLLGSFLSLYVIFLMYTISYNAPEYLNINLFDIISFFKKRLLWLFMWLPPALVWIAGVFAAYLINNDIATKICMAIQSLFLLYYCSSIIMRYIFNKPPEEPELEERQSKTVEAM